MHHKVRGTSAAATVTRNSAVVPIQLGLRPSEALFLVMWDVKKWLKMDTIRFKMRQHKASLGDQSC